MSNPNPSEAWLETPEGEHLLLRGNYSLGRSSDNQFVVASERASRRHAVIHAQEGGEFWLADLGSANGTFLNSRRLVRPTRLKDGDIVTVAHASLTFHQTTSLDTESDEGQPSQMTIVDVRTEPCWLLVADLEDFTGVSQRLAPDALAALVGRWVRTCKEQIEGRGGVINKYLGDGFLAFWRADEGSAVKVAEAVRGLRAARKKSEISFRVILHHGRVALGGAASMGEESLMGPEVNFIFRMEKVASFEKIAICASAAAQPLLADHLTMTPVPGEHELKGFSKRYRFFEVEP